MSKIDDINSILNAVNEIYLKPKKKISKILTKQNFIPKLNQDLIIPLDVDKIISEAEEYKKKLLFKSSQVDLIQNKNDLTKTKNNNKIFEETQSKIIFKLRLKIKDLEKQLKNYKIEKIKFLEKDKLILKNKVSEPLKTQDPSINQLEEILSKNKKSTTDEVVSYLKIQDTSITFLNKKINQFKSTEEKLLSQIINLEQDKTILLKKVEKFNDSKDYKNIIRDTKKNLKTIYKQVEKQKIIFLNLKNYLIKNERDFNFYKENYKKLIIENDGIKKKL